MKRQIYSRENARSQFHRTYRRVFAFNHFDFCLDRVYDTADLHPCTALELAAHTFRINNHHTTAHLARVQP